MGTVWLIIAVAVAGVAAGAAAGLALGHSTRDARGNGIVAGSTLERDGLIPILAALSSTIVLLDDDGEVLRASAAAYTYNIVHDDEVSEPQVAQMVDRVRATGRAQDAEITVARGRVAGAGNFHLQVRVAGIGRGRVLVLIEDRTAARRVEDMRRDFVVNASHELKTPVGAISLLAETVRDNADDPALVADYAERMSRESRRLELLVGDIIELSRLQDGDALVEPEDVSVDDVVVDALDRVRVEADAKEVVLVSGGTENLHVLGDASLLVTAVSNLLDNAIRYSDPRTRVSVGLSVDANDPELVRIAVVDQGIGIPKEAQERVFERFYRVDKARSRATGGTGLGLSIVKHVAADHGGTVELWSAPGRGSTFTLVLPRHRTAADLPGPAPEAVQAVASGAAGASFAAIAAISDAPVPKAPPSTSPATPDADPQEVRP
ncbi:sensor histidine kinase [Actinomyces ruminicola]|uniref:Sensor-like histidine kinase SenX3 n=1 Tax=Actinomyces ruminicola TaxID=332524 RepID=A0A1G9V7C0_9ACTO|nr:ATP-binding protein [Actinomyces ruminicola]SDM68098.1 two-component system, OmpR family, sensor histidine kinase SenX3 [Actinomyces ruminicola]